tara:strand:+ start:58 stop:204 length:147 start_codon:yes stop_codon:yes gene_type:complete
MRPVYAEARRSLKSVATLSKNKKIACYLLKFMYCEVGVTRLLDRYYSS